MGACSSSPFNDTYKESRERSARSTLIEKSLKLEQERAKPNKNASNSVDIKILILGTGDTGKTTVLKQLKLLYGSGFSDSEIIEFRSIILTNLVTCAKALVAAMSQLHIPYGFDPERIESFQQTVVNSCSDQEVSTRSTHENYVQTTAKITASEVDPTPTKKDDNNSNNNNYNNQSYNNNNKDSVALTANALFDAENILPSISNVVQCIKSSKTDFGFSKDAKLDPVLIDSIKMLWEDSGIQ
ncbi:Guanine nucleotide-binding protein subunit alpha-15, partial [Physocladia obscura]